MNQLLPNHQTHSHHIRRVNVKINHPKLTNLTLAFKTHQPLSDIHHYLQTNTLLQLFTNYYLELEGNVVSSKKTITEVLPQKATQLQFNVVFQHYNYATAMQHFQVVARLLQVPHKLAILLRADQKHIQDITAEPEGLSKELIPSSFKIPKTNIQEIIAPHYKHQFWKNTVQQQSQFVQYLGMSGFHPPTQAQLSGDLFYIHAKTLQNADLHITASPLGFYLNQSKINNYNPAPVPGRPTYTSLLDLLSNSSERFLNAYSSLSELKDQSLMEQLSRRQDSILLGSSDKEEWLDSVQTECQWNTRRQSTFKEHEKTQASCSDWNEMFLDIERRAQQMKVISENQSNIWMHAALRFAYQKFEEAAIYGAKKIAEGKIQAMNHTDQKKKHIYVHNRIFFSITQDTPTNHTLDKGEELIPTGSSSNTDLLQLASLILNRPAHLHLLHTVLVFYRGYRIIAQTILPGLLSSELNNLTQYGSVDDNKSINNNPQFHQLLLPICKTMHLDSCIQAFDKDDKLVEVAISPQIKGICSSNGQKYLCDLQRFSPRDLNYMGAENEGCVLRTELIIKFFSQKKIPDLLPINPNIATSIRFKNSAKTEQQEKQLKVMANYLQEQALTRLANTLKSKAGGDYLTDSQGLAKVFHSHGVNMRYMGQLYQHQTLRDSIDVKICLCRGILVRSLKHIFREVLRQSNPLHLSSTIAHMLNCIFAKKNQISLLSQSCQQQDRQESSQPKRKKKKKQKQQEFKNTVQQDNKVVKLEQSHYQNIRPQELWEQVKQIAKARFNHHLDNTITEFCTHGLFRLEYQKYATLRDLCFCIGLKLQRKNYLLRERDHEQGMPFSPKNIVGFSARAKIPTHTPPPEIQAAVQFANRLFSQNQFAQALKSYEEACQIMRERKQGSQLSHCLGQISRINFMLGNIKEAFNIQAGNLAFIYRNFCQDSFEAVRCYSRLGLYCMTLGISDLALWLLGRGLNLMLTCFGQAYPDVLINLSNIARVYFLKWEIQLASSCYLKALDILSNLHGHKTHINASFCYSSLAGMYYETGEYRKAVDYQQQAANILMKALPSDDPRTLDAQKILKVYKQMHISQSRNMIDHHQRRKN